MRRRSQIVLAIVALSALANIGSHAQTPSASNNTEAAFEVASVKPNRSSGNVFPQVQVQAGGRFVATNLTLQGLLVFAYGLNAGVEVEGPAWLNVDRFDVLAEAPSDPALLQRDVGRAASMLRTLLAERFKLVLHRAHPERPIYALVFARSDKRLGPQIHPSATDCTAVLAARRGVPPSPPPLDQRPQCGSVGRLGAWSGGAAPLASLVVMLTRQVGRTVVDRTGLTGRYDIDLNWTPDQAIQRTLTGAPPLPGIDPNGPSIFTALQEQLGLKLEPTTAPVDVLVIDHVEPPTPD